MFHSAAGLSDTLLSTSTAPPINVIPSMLSARVGSSTNICATFVNGASA
jgi:hypothetical protein